MRRAAQQFNEAQFWESHETLEEVWQVSSDPQKRFLQGIIQAAAGFVHVQKHNPKGAISLFTQSLEKLTAVEDVADFHAWIDLHGLIEAVRHALHTVQAQGTGGITQFPTLIVYD